MARETLCPECGIGASVDQEGLCVQCGATATGSAVAGILAVLRRAEGAEALLRETGAILKDMGDGILEAIGSPPVAPEPEPDFKVPEPPAPLRRCHAINWDGGRGCCCLPDGHSGQHTAYGGPPHVHWDDPNPTPAPLPEPDGWVCRRKWGNSYGSTAESVLSPDSDESFRPAIPLYAAPPAALPAEVERVIAAAEAWYDNRDKPLDGDWLQRDEALEDDLDAAVAALRSSRGDA